MNSRSALRRLDPNFPISARCVIQRENMHDWANIVRAAESLSLDHISFLPADVSTDAFNRTNADSDKSSEEILPKSTELKTLYASVETVISEFGKQIDNNFILESSQKLMRIYEYYAAFHMKNPFPIVRCNAPWVSSVVEADGTVRPCFFHEPIGSVNDAQLIDVLNSDKAVAFRESLNVSKDSICRKCVCSLYLEPNTDYIEVA